MKRFLFAVTLIAVTVPVIAADVVLSVRIGQPGFYGQIDIGDYPQPRVIYRRPIRVERVEMDRPPIYLRVPPGYAKNWKKHCREYNACGERVYFVQNTWYQREYVPRYQERQRAYRDERRGRERNEERYEERSEQDKRPGNSRGNSQGNGHNR